jgi:hypothetical protein
MTSLPFRYRVFISFRLSEAGSAAEHLKAALSLRNVTAFVAHVDSSGNIAEDVSAALLDCELFVILGTANFGEETDVQFSTFNELRMARQEMKPLFLIKMCDDFRVPMARFWLPESMPYVVWEPCTDVPREVVDGICEFLQRM